LYAWPGVQTAGTLYSASDYVNFIPNVTAAGTSSAALAGSTTPSNMILALTVVSSTATTKTIVVHAKDAITGQPLHDATVVVYSVSGKTDTPLTYSTTPPDECIETVGGADAGTDPRGHPTKGSTGKVLNTCRGRVTKSGYHVATFKP
jgi:hypothetical protein